MRISDWSSDVCSSDLLMTPKLQLGVGYGARVACGCRYIEGRPLKSCYKDFEPGMEVIHLADDPKTRTITASVPLVASRKVTFDPVLGCQPEPYKQIGRAHV